MVLTVKQRSSVYKMHGGLQVTDNVIGIVLFVVIMGAAFWNMDTIMNFGRWASEQYEMSNMKTAALTYRGLRYDGASPTSAEDLINGLDTTTSIDGASHTGLMSAKSGRWHNGSYNDAWGQPFSFTTDSDGSHKIISGGSDMTIGTDDDITVYY